MSDMEEPLVDPLLQVFVKIMNHAGVQVGVSLLVGGGWLSGVLISPRMYTEEMAQFIRQASPMAAPLALVFEEAGRIWYPSDSEAEALPEADVSDEPRGPYFAHLRGARSFAALTPVPADGSYARVRLDRVAAWSVGELGERGYQTPPPPPPPA